MTRNSTFTLAGPDLPIISQVSQYVPYDTPVVSMFHVSQYVPDDTSVVCIFMLVSMSPDAYTRGLCFMLVSMYLMIHSWSVCSC